MRLKLFLLFANNRLVWSSCHLDRHDRVSRVASAVARCVTPHKVLNALGDCNGALPLEGDAFPSFLAQHTLSRALPSPAARTPGDCSSRAVVERRHHLGGNGIVDCA